jgi:hypothetical protein
MLQLDLDRPFLDNRLISFDGYRARGKNYRAGPDVEPSLVEVAFNHIAFQKTLRKRAWTVSTSVVGHEKLAPDMVNREDEARCLHFAYFSIVDFFYVAESYTWHGRILILRLELIKRPVHLEHTENR